MPLVTRLGLLDGAYESNGQVVLCELQALVLARLAAVPVQRLWDVGAGAGSIGIKWMRSHPTCRAEAVDVEGAGRSPRPQRNAARRPPSAGGLGACPDVLTRLPAPDPVFIGERFRRRCWWSPPGGPDGRWPAGGHRGHRGDRGGARRPARRAGGRGHHLVGDGPVIPT
jgi:hypothetical protein